MPLMMRSVPVLKPSSSLTPSPSSFNKDSQRLEWSEPHTSRLWFHTSFIYSLHFLFLFLHLYSSSPSLWRDIISGPYRIFHFILMIDSQGDTSAFHLHTVPFTLLAASNGGDSQSAVPELVSPSLGVSVLIRDVARREGRLQITSFTVNRRCTWKCDVPPLFSELRKFAERQWQRPAYLWDTHQSISN